jgi:GAF domain-containing protein
LVTAWRPVARCNEVDDHGVAAFEAHHEERPTPLQADDLATLDEIGERLLRAIARHALQRRHLDRLDLATRQIFFELASQRFDFR